MIDKDEHVRSWRRGAAVAHLLMGPHHHHSHDSPPPPRSPEGRPMDLWRHWPRGWRNRKQTENAVLTGPLLPWRQTDIYLQKELVTKAHETPQRCRFLPIAISIIINLGTLGCHRALTAPGRRSSSQYVSKSSVKYETLVASSSPKPLLWTKEREWGSWLEHWPLS